ncbi:hypothetical protein Droror1_Dr00006766 [Drosera rotundifolia]
MAAMASERSRVLHNFTLPSHLSWGVQRQLRCTKTDEINGGGGGQTPRGSDRNRRDSPDSERRRRSEIKYYECRRNSPKSALIGGGGLEEETIEVVREKLMMDLHKEVDKMKVKMLSEKEIEDPVRAAPETRPWNLRTRRAACREPTINGGGAKSGVRIEEMRRPSFSPQPVRTTAVATTEIKSPPRRKGDEEIGGGGGNGGGEKRPRAKFSVALTRQEVEDDFMEIVGKRPPRKPKKRPRYVQKELDTLFPGLWLSEITADMYRVDEIPELVK